MKESSGQDRRSEGELIGEVRVPAGVLGAPGMHM